MSALRKRWRLTLATRLALVVACAVVLTAAVVFVLMELWPGRIVFNACLAALIVLPVAIAATRAELHPLFSMLRALGGTVISYRDGDYSFGLHWARDDEIGELVRAHNELGDVLREQRLSLVQRELLLDTMVQNTPVAMLLVRDEGNIVFANIVARQLLHRGKRLEGADIERVMGKAFASLREAYSRGGDGLFTVSHEPGTDAQDEIYHMARRQFALNGRAHELLLLRHLTAELRRQEVQTWKKVIRVISHELNNSLAPVASLASSGAELVRRGQVERLPSILKTIEERTRHLEGFIEGYAKFAKLPAPRIDSVEWQSLVAALQSQVPFRLAGALPPEPVRIDVAQIEQALLNLLKNAHESGSDPMAIEVAIRRSPEVVSIDVMDRGSGMTDAVMSQALVPFYSTKRSGTGLGLALSREIAEAHGGRVALANREGGGLTVSMFLPV